MTDYTYVHHIFMLSKERKKEMPFDIEKFAARFLWQVCVISTHNWGFLAAEPGSPCRATRAWTRPCSWRRWWTLLEGWWLAWADVRTAACSSSPAAWLPASNTQCIDPEEPPLCLAPQDHDDLKWFQWEKMRENTIMVWLFTVQRLRP